MGRPTWDQTFVCEYRTEGPGKQTFFFWDRSQKKSAREVYVSPKKAIEEQA